MVALSYLAVASCAFGSISASLGPLGFQPGLVLRSEDVAAQLRPHLSKNAQIFFPGSAGFANATLRWQTYADPTISVAVEVATEDDISVTIKAANELGLPFLAKSGGHGAIDSLGNMKEGIEIYMRALNTVEVNLDGQTAKMGGGLVAKEVTDALWPLGKQTITGACECTGMLGPALGGGHGWLQGRYGLSTDNLVEARLVLADGSIITVNEHEHADLFWGIRGAGHNFGIVSSFTYKIHDVPKGDIWTYESFFFGGDKVEEVFGLTNKLTGKGTQPVEFINFSYFIRIPAVDPVNPVINFFILYQGTPSEENTFGAQYRALKPLNVTLGTATYPELSAITGNGDQDIACQHGYAALRFPISLVEYNLTSQRTIYNRFSQVTSEQPLFNNSFFLFEGYSLQGVKAVPQDSTAFPDRTDNLLVSPVIIYYPNSTLDAPAIAVGKEIRQILLEGSSRPNELNAYVNYAHGDETLAELYGHEAWRVPRLQALKAKFDPHGRFNFYAPLS